MATACLEKPTTIWEGYLQKAIHELEVGPLPDTESSRSRATVYHDCAVFAERNTRQFSNHLMQSAGEFMSRERGKKSRS